MQIDVESSPEVLSTYGSCVSRSNINVHFTGRQNTPAFVLRLNDLAKCTRSFFVLFTLQPFPDGWPLLELLFYIPVIPLVAPVIQTDCFGILVYIGAIRIDTTLTYLGPFVTSANINTIITIDYVKMSFILDVTLQSVRVRVNTILYTSMAILCVIHGCHGNRHLSLNSAQSDSKYVLGIGIFHACVLVYYCT